MKKLPHNKLCSAPICMADKSTDWQKKVIWYPGEKVCDKKPYSKVQKLQIELNKFVNRRHLKELDKFFTLDDLEKISLPKSKDRISYLITLLGIKNQNKKNSESKKTSKKKKGEISNHSTKAKKKAVLKSKNSKKNKNVARNSFKNKKIIKTGSRPRKVVSQKRNAMRFSKL